MSESEPQLYSTLLVAGFVAAAVVFAVLFFVAAPYGRHARRGWGPTIPALYGWLLMEAPAPVFMPVFFLWSAGTHPTLAWVFLAFWLTHYGYRGWIYPFRRRNTKARMAVFVAGMGMAFNVFNGYMNGHDLGVHAAEYGADWFTGPQFICGALLFAIGLAVNHQSDETLMRLRKPGEAGYRIPEGGLYRWVSSPNYLGEIVEWTGWAVMTWSAGGVLFAVWTVANLMPRAISNHRWYRETFPEYPASRRAIIPFIV